MMEYEMPKEVFSEVSSQIGYKFGKTPFRFRGIIISDDLVRTTIELLNNEPSKLLPQNSRNASKDKTPDGLDRRIKEVLKTDLRTANIISDILKEVGVVQVIDVINPPTGRKVKGTRLSPEWCW
jgi:hypothetical protein